MPRDGIPNYALERLAQDRAETDRFAVRSLSWGALLEKEGPDSPTPVVRHTARRKKETIVIRGCEIIQFKILKKFRMNATRTKVFGVV